MVYDKHNLKLVVIMPHLPPPHLYRREGVGQIVCPVGVGERERVWIFRPIHLHLILSAQLGQKLQASYLEGGPLMWMLALSLHINKKSDYDMI